SWGCGGRSRCSACWDRGGDIPYGSGRTWASGDGRSRWAIRTGSRSTRTPPGCRWRASYHPPLSPALSTCLGGMLGLPCMALPAQWLAVLCARGITALRAVQYLVQVVCQPPATHTQHGAVPLHLCDQPTPTFLCPTPYFRHGIQRLGAP